MDYSSSGTFVMVGNDVPFNDLSNYLVTAPGREDEDDGFFMVDMNQAIGQYDKWMEHLPRVRPFYAVKCNADPVLVRCLSKLGAGFDCASKGEIQLALDMGAKPSDIVYAHPCKKSSHLRFALHCGVSMMTFDSEPELQKIKQIYPNAELLLRFRLHGTNIAVSIDVSGSKFGASLHSCGELLLTAKNLGLNVVGISFHVGSGCYNALVYQDAIRSAKNLFDLGKKAGHSFTVLDIGGGFPGKPTEYSFEEMSSVIKCNLDECFPVESGVRIIAEPGRYFASSPYTFVANITLVKEVRKNEVEDRDEKNPPVQFQENGPETGYMYYIDDGLHGSFSDILEDPSLYKPLPMNNKDSAVYPSRIWGQTLNPKDSVNSNCQLPKLSVGDWVYFNNMGAYTCSLSSGFNGFQMQRHKYYYMNHSTWKQMKKEMRKEIEHFGSVLVFPGNHDDCKD